MNYSHAVNLFHSWTVFPSPPAISPRVEVPLNLTIGARSQDNTLKTEDEKLQVFWSDEAVSLPIPFSDSHIYTPESTVTYKSKAGRFYYLHVCGSGQHSHSGLVPAPWPTPDASTNLGTDLAGMRLDLCQSSLGYSCNSQQCYKRSHWLLVVLSPASPVKQPSTCSQPASPGLLSSCCCPFPEPTPSLFSPWLRVSIIPHSLILLLIFHPLAPTKKWKVPYSFSQPNLLKSFCPERQ